MTDPDVEMTVNAHAHAIMEFQPTWSPRRCLDRAYIELVKQGVLKDEIEDGKDPGSRASIAAGK